MTFYFYDLETSGINARTARIMQFAGIRTDENFNPLGKPLNCLVRLSEEVLPDPEAVLVHGVSPQKANQEGYSEAEFLRIFSEHALAPDTIIMGFNTIRFDDEFMRYTLYRNFYDPYEWQWQDGRTRWDLIDVVRMTRALRPDGIEWPYDAEGKETNRLELLTKANGISHEDAHDAMSDVYATIDMAKLIKAKQPKIFDYLLQHRTKQAVATLLDVQDPKPFMHTSGMLSSEFAKTSVFIPICPHPHNSNAVIAYDLRYDPTEFSSLSSDEIKETIFTPWRELEASSKKRLPVKGIHLNKAPAIAPLGILSDKVVQDRVGLTPEIIQRNLAKLSTMKDFAQLVATAYEREKDAFPPSGDVDQDLYAGFVGDNDKHLLRLVRGQNEDSIADLHPEFKDQRLPELLMRYKARNYPMALSDTERETWDIYRAHRLNGGINGALGLKDFAIRLDALLKKPDLTDEKKFLLEELRLYAESIID